MQSAIFLDRDGVINQAEIREGKPYPPADLKSLELMPGIRKVLKELISAGYLLVIVTNQPDVARGFVSRESVEEINAFLLQQLPIKAIKTCFHDDSDGCECRKPLPGALIKAASEYQIDLNKSFMIGDRWKDIEAGKKAGCKTIFIDYRYNERRPDSPDFIVNSIQEISKIILGINDEKSK